ncbi:hypothetical protein [Candidatus Enterovibrio escicola]
MLKYQVFKGTTKQEKGMMG